MPRAALLPLVTSRDGTVALQAYFLGKNVAHLPTILLAPLVFLAMYYQLAHPLAPFFTYYLLFVLVYATACGLAYLISIVFNSSIAQLVGVLSVLVCMVRTWCILDWASGCIL